MATQQGQRKRIRRRISQVIKRVENQLMDGVKLPYFEPFCGICSVLRHFLDEKERQIYASDIDPDLIFLWTIIQNTRTPPCKCSDEEYLQSDVNTPTNTNDKHFLANISKRLVKISDNVQNVSFEGPCSYDEYDPKGMLIYCDPPYRENSTDESFWTIMRKWNENNLVFITSHSAPTDFVKIWQDQGHVDSLYIHRKLAILLPSILKRELKTY